MRSLKLTLTYDGTNYFGWQVQADQPTIQETLETAFHKVTGEKLRMVASGRTDAGVHAIGQVVSLATDCQLSPETLRRALNANVPRDILITDVRLAPEGFHAIRDAVRKRYRYVIHDGDAPDVFWQRYCWFVRGDLDDQAMDVAAGQLVGTFDFTAYESAGSERATSVRTVSELAVKREHLLTMETRPVSPHKIVIEIESDGFLYNMVRNIVGTLVEVGRHAKPVDWPSEVLKTGDRRNAGQTAPAQGLVLVQVDYPF